MAFLVEGQDILLRYVLLTENKNNSESYKWMQYTCLYKHDAAILEWVHHFLVYTAGGGKSGNFDGVYMKSILSYFTAVHTKALNNASHRAALNGKHNKPKPNLFRKCSCMQKILPFCKRRVLFWKHTHFLYTCYIVEAGAILDCAKLGIRRTIAV